MFDRGENELGSTRPKETKTISPDFSLLQGVQRSLKMFNKFVKVRDR
jgi:hypothetical protein